MQSRDEFGIGSWFWLAPLIGYNVGMATVLALAELCIATGVLFSAFKRFRGQGIGWWIALGFAAILGGSIGIWLGFRFSYHLDPRVLVHGFPVPEAFYVLEHYTDGTQQWVDFITPTPTLIATANAFFVLSIAIAAITITHFFVLRWRRQSVA